MDHVVAGGRSPGFVTFIGTLELSLTRSQLFPRYAGEGFPKPVLGASEADEVHGDQGANACRNNRDEEVNHNVALIVSPEFFLGPEVCSFFSLPSSHCALGTHGSALLAQLFVAPRKTNWELLVRRTAQSSIQSFLSCRPCGSPLFYSQSHVSLLPWSTEPRQITVFYVVMHSLPLSL